MPPVREEKLTGKKSVEKGKQTKKQTTTIRKPIIEEGQRPSNKKANNVESKVPVADPR